MQADANALKKILISTVTKNHPDDPFKIEEEEYFACRNFLANFISDNKGKVFTLNYDLLLYWTVMRTEFSDGGSVELVARDGFGDDDPDTKQDYVVWQGEAGRARSSVFYLHGALHLFDGRHQIQKFTWKRTEKRLKEQSWEAIQNGSLPLFVAEGKSYAKMEKINHNAYLYQAYRSLKNTVTQKKCAFFVHGHSLAENDSHILNLLGRGNFPQLFIGLHGDPTSPENEEVIQNARTLVDLRRSYPLDLFFYDSASARVWG